MIAIFIDYLASPHSKAQWAAKIGNTFSPIVWLNEQNIPWDIVCHRHGGWAGHEILLIFRDEADLAFFLMRYPEMRPYLRDIPKVHKEGDAWLWV